MLTRPSLFKAGCVFLAATAVTVLIVYMAFGGMAPAAAAAEEHAVAEEVHMRTTGLHLLGVLPLLPPFTTGKQHAG